MFKRIAGPQNFETTVNGVTVEVRKNGALWEVLLNGEIVAWGGTRKAAVAMFAKAN